MLTFRDPEDKTSCIVLNLLKTENQRSGAAREERVSLQSSRRERMKADASVVVAWMRACVRVVCVSNYCVWVYVSACVRVCACVRAFVRAFVRVRACVRARVCVCARVSAPIVK